MPMMMRSFSLLHTYMKYAASGFTAGMLAFGVGLHAQNSSPNRPNPQLADPKIEAKIDLLLKQMTLEEKAGQLIQYAGGTSPTPSSKQVGSGKSAADVNPTSPEMPDPMALAERGLLGSVLNTWGPRAAELQKAALASRLHIPLLFGADVIHGYRTIFPIPLAMASSFDTELIEQVEHTAGSEATTGGIKWVYSPMVDIARDARWGRVAESAGEDPYLGSAIARAYVRGFQGHDLADPENVAVSVKHYAAYGAAEAGREYNTTDMSDITLRQVYLQPYEAAVKAGAATMMSSFNSLNGVPATGNPYLMTKILRGEWHFDGMVVSDYNAVAELMHHGIALDGATAAQKALDAGVDVDMMAHLYDRYLPELVRSGKVSQATLDEAVRRELRVKFALGLFDHPYARPGGEVTAAVPEHLPLARKAAQESVILLKNDSSALPLKASPGKIALIGPLADATGEMAGTWAMGANNSDVSTLRAALEDRCKKAGCSLAYEKGTEIETDSEDGFAAAAQAAQNADVVVMALGESQGMSGEAASRAHLDLPGNQEKLLEAVAKTGKPVVLVVFSGRPLVLNWAAEHVPAIVEAWFLGDEAGNALADVLFGDVNPSGRVPLSFPRAVGQEPLYYAQLPTGRPAEGRDRMPSDGAKQTKFFSRYLDVRNDALFPFGYGLSYTTFSYSNVKVSVAAIPLAKAYAGSHATPLINVTATLTNTGTREGTEVAQLYVNNDGTSVSQSVRQLKGFERVTLKPGESKQLSFSLGFDELSFYNVESKQVVEPTHYTVWVGGSSLASEGTTFDVTH